MGNLTIGAALSMSPRVSTVLFFLAQFIEMGMDNKFDFIVANVTEKMSSTGEFDVEVALHFKKPLFQPRGKTPSFLLRSFEP